MALFINGMMQSTFYLMIAMGLTVVFGIMHIINFAHGSLYMLGAYFCYYFYMAAGLNYWLAMLLCFLTLGILGIILQSTVFRRFLGKFGGGLLIAIALSMIIDASAYIGFGPYPYRVDSVFKGIVSIFGSPISTEWLAVIVTSLLLIAGLLLFIKFTKTGRAMQAVEQNQEAATLQGMSVNRIANTAMFIGCGLAGAAGAIMAPVAFLTPSMGGVIMFRGLFVIIIGGMGTVAGTIIGAFIIGFVEVLGSYYLGMSFGILLSFVVAMIIFMIKPTGLLGHEYARM